jgi:hypothetical protein
VRSAAGNLNYEDKLRSAKEYQLEDINWPVLVDDYEGTGHRTYSQEMADPSFLIDAEGRVAFYCMWTHAPSLKPAFDELLAGRCRHAGRRRDRQGAAPVRVVRRRSARAAARR